MFPNQGSSIHFHHFRVKNKSRHTEKLYLFSSPVSHVTDTLFVKTWGGKSYAKSVACEQIPSDISITHAVPCKTTSLESCGRELNGATTEHRALPCLPLDLHPWHLLLAAVLGFPFNCKVSLSLVTLLCIFSLQLFAVTSGCSVVFSSSSFNLAIDYCCRDKINSFQANLHGEKQMIVVWIAQE